MIDFEKIKQRELEKHKQEFYSEKNKLKRHNEMLEHDTKTAEKTGNVKIMWSSCNNDWS